MFSGRDPVIPRATLDNAKKLYKKAGITNPRKEIDCAEIYVPFSWFEPMWMEGMLIAERNEGWKMTYEGATALDGDFPVNMSGGVLSSNPIGASGLLRFAEAAMQVRGRRASTRWTARAARSATPTAAARSTSPPGSSAATSPDVTKGTYLFRKHLSRASSLTEKERPLRDDRLGGDDMALGFWNFAERIRRRSRW